MGIMIGALGAMAPNRREHIAELVFSAMIAGNAACFLTGCIAGIHTLIYFRFIEHYSH